MAQGLMEARRLRLQDILEETLGSNHVYFQPPTNLQMQYPAIVYQYDYATAIFADNEPYSVFDRYQVTLIHDNPDNDILHKIQKLPKASFVRHFKAGNLNHYILRIYF